MVIETGCRIFLVIEFFELPSEENVCAAMLGIMSELDEHKGCSGSRILFFSIPVHNGSPEHPSIRRFNKYDYEFKTSIL